MFVVVLPTFIVIELYLIIIMYSLNLNNLNIMKSMTTTNKCIKDHKRYIIDTS